MIFKKNHYISILFFLTAHLGFAQQLAYNGNPDRSFFVARNLAFEGNRTIARDTLQRILTKYPDYSDVRNLLASTHSWDGNYEIAREHFNKITSKDRKNKEAWVAAIKNEIYAKEYYLALGLSNKALVYLEDDEDIKSLQRQARSELDDTVDTEKEAPDGKTLDTLEISIGADKLKNQLEVTNSFDIFDIVYDPMVYSSIGYTRKTNAGSVIPRINYANRFQTHGVQYEMDFYPKFSKTFYGFINFGVSGSPIFPDHKAGAELYVNLPKSIEASLGVRYLDFDATSALIYTLSLGLYHGDYYFSLRPYVAPRENGNADISGSVLMRKYYDADKYIGVRASVGFAPELNQLLDGDTILAETLLYAESQRVQLEYQFRGMQKTNIFRTNLGVARQELVFDSGNFFWAVSAGFTCQVRF